MMPVPQGVISTSTGPAEATPSVVEEAIEVAVEEELPGEPDTTEEN